MQNRRRTLRLLAAFGVSAAAAVHAPGPMAQRRAHDVLVVGAGVFGVWTAWHLHRAGKRVALIDAIAPAHSTASSGGESRVTRCGYGDAALYTEWACRSLAAWQSLSERAALPLFHPLGVLWIHDAENRLVADTAAT